MFKTSLQKVHFSNLGNILTKNTQKCFVVMYKIQIYSSTYNVQFYNILLESVQGESSMTSFVSPFLQVSVYRHGEKIPDAKPLMAPKTIIPPKLPIEMPQTKSQPAPSPAPAAHSPTPSRAAVGKAAKSPTPSRRK